MDLIFQRSSGNSFCIEVGYFDTVLEIKENIQKEQGIPLSKQTLMFKGKILNDDLNIHYSEILNQSHIQIFVTSDAGNNSPPPSPKPRPFSEMMADSFEKLNNQIRRFKKSIHILGRSGKELGCKVVSKTSGASSSRKNEGRGKKMRFIVLYGAEKIPMVMREKEKVGKVRKKLHKKKVKLPKGGFFFIFEQNVMDENESLKWHRVAGGDSIEIVSGTISRSW